MENEITIGPKDFYKKEIIYKKLYIDRNNKSLIIGKLEDERHNVISNAVIIIYEEGIIPNDSSKKEIGFTISDESGNFRILLERSDNKNYILEVFTLINK